MPSNKFKNWVNLEVDKKLDQEHFSSLPLRMRIGIFLLIGSFIIGYGIPVLIMILSGIKRQLTAGLVNSTVIYLFSWFLGAFGLFLAGKDCIKYPIFFFAKLIKKLFPDYFSNENH
jgi:hypothetical protein